MKWLISLFLGLSTMALIVLWFCLSHRELSIKASMMKSAETQLLASRKQAELDSDDPNAMGILERSLDIYLQSTERYNETLRKPWIFIPGLIMGYRMAESDDINK